MRSAAVVSLALLCGCAHHYPRPVAGAPEQQRFNRDAAGRGVTVTQTDATPLVVAGPELRVDSLHWYDVATSRAGVVTGLPLGAIAFIGVAGNCQGTTCSVSSRLPVFLVVIPTGFLGALIRQRGRLEHALLDRALRALDRTFVRAHSLFRVRNGAVTLAHRARRRPRQRPTTPRMRLSRAMRWQGAVSRTA